MSDVPEGLRHCLACDGHGVLYVMQPGPDLDEREVECRQCGGSGLAVDLGTCTMCEEEPATTTWIFPVCQSCYQALADTQEMLEKTEAEDPALAEQGRRVEESWLEFVEEQRGRPQ